jgi:hypothetical protein
MKRCIALLSEPEPNFKSVDIIKRQKLEVSASNSEQEDHEGVEKLFHTAKESTKTLMLTSKVNGCHMLSNI